MTLNGVQIQIWGCNAKNPNQVWSAGYQAVTGLPVKSQNGQYGTNSCGTTSDQSANCQTSWIKCVHCVPLAAGSANVR